MGVPYLGARVGPPPLKLCKCRIYTGLCSEKPGLPANGRAKSQEKSKGLAPTSPKRKARKFFLFTLLFVLVCVIGAGVAIVGYQTYKELKKNTVSSEAYLLYTRT